MFDFDNMLNKLFDWITISVFLFVLLVVPQIIDSL